MGRSEFNEWHRYAKDDLEAAQYLLSMPKRKLEIICYHSQQCAEKSLKAILALHDLSIPHTHDLRILVNTLEHISSFDEIAEQLVYLQPFAVAVRYPYEIELVSGDEEVAVTAADAILKYIERIAA
jgi:HEPN domain-containing protein